MSKFYFTRHANTRLVERHIDPKVVELCEIYGKKTIRYGLYMLKLENIPAEAFQKMPKKFVKRLEKMLPVCTAFNLEQETVITAFRVNQRINWKRGKCFTRPSAIV